MSSEGELIAIEEAAANWLVARDRGFSRERERELERWLEADARHAAAFNALAETWALMGESRVVPVECDRSALRGARSRQTWIATTLAAAAAVLVGVGWWRLGHVSETDTAAPFTLASSTEVGVLRTVPLPDGSIIQLNTDSAVDVQYSAAERRVKLARGEAHFTVAKHRDRPFIVSVAGVDVRVMGTVFNVRLRPGTVDVLVTQGKVRVDAPVVAARTESLPVEGRRAELTAGQKLSIELQSPTAPAAPAVTRTELSAGEIKQALAWKSRRLDFDAARLDQIVAEMNRYNRHQLVVVDPRLTERRFGGSFPAGDCETIVRMLETNFGVVAERKDGETWLRLKATK